MSRDTGPVCRQCRREGTKLFLKGARCYTKKCSFERRPTPPGMHAVRRRKVGDYGLQLREKQKMRRVYRLGEAQFRRLFEEAERGTDVTGEHLLRLLELRLDNVVYRLGLASSRDQARQFITHGHIAVNGSVLNIPSYSLKPGDAVAIRAEHAELTPFKEARETLKGAGVEWLRLDAAKLTGEVIAAPRRDQMPGDFNEQLVVEFYSR
ncbi:MAG: 30S ribosomal protein S4 [Chloroflexi bacterium]|jgi:small subunit ribosomal protein S4|nr:MAG: 30S ribosomal protein S4 [Chloroflexota bacterium]RLT29934.1 MAG: 30S ribosomal protein S4 [Chloroflexota bacterium]